MAPAATALGLHLRVLVESPTSSAAQVVVDAPVGLGVRRGGDRPARRRRRRADLRARARAERAARPPGGRRRRGPPRRGRAGARAGQDRHAHPADRARRAGPGLGGPAVAPRTSTTFLADHGGVAVVKTSRGGYDGKGVRVVRGADEVADWFAAAADGTGAPLLAEEKVPFTRELAVLVARRPSGEMRTWPVVESVQRDGVCSEVVAPAPDLDPATQAEARRRGHPDRRGPRRDGRARRRAVRGRRTRRAARRACSSTSSRCDRTTPATGPSTAP